MAFDQPTRNRLARFVKDARDLITDEFTQKFAERFGIADDGTCAPLEKLTHLDEPGLATAALLRQRIDYLVRSHPEEREGRAAAVKRLAREQAFTVLNRLAALRMAEKRQLILESVGKGYQSKGYKLYATVAGTGLGETYERYRRYLFCLCDELAVDLGALFDRHSPHGILFPREPALLGLLDLLNAADLEHLWAEDETIGWIYQYYNDESERKKMREASSAPRNSRELAVRNQFFTPRYVVEFLTDNTLGRIWYEMTQGKTALRERCRYLVRRPNEIFLEVGATVPSRPDAESSNLSQEELLRAPVHIPHRPLKDPRELRMLDPACGSMHFGLYAFDLFEVIYEEYWERSEGVPPSKSQGKGDARSQRNEDVPSSKSEDPEGKMPSLPLSVPPSNSVSQRNEDVPSSKSTANEGKMPSLPLDASLPYLNTQADIAKRRTHLPHWEQDAVTYFLTWRLADSLPVEKLQALQAEREHWLARHPQPWDDATEDDYHRRFSDRLDEWLDAGVGRCTLRDPALAAIVAGALRHFDGERYRLDSFVVMPNHVHVLVQLAPGQSLAKLMHSWKSFTAKEINRALGESGTLWQEDYFDRIIRNDRHLAATRRYIETNPTKGAKDALLQRHAGILPQRNEDVPSSKSNAVEGKMPSLRLGVPSSNSVSQRNEDVPSSKSEQSEGRMPSLRSLYATKEAFLREIPRLIVEHNIHGVDIDPRAAQIAALSLWLRAQKSWSQQGLAAAARPRITRSHIVCAEPMPGDKALLADFVERAFPAAERPVFQHLLERIFDHMQLAGEAGSLLKIEEEIRTAIEEARALWEKSRTVSRELFSTEVINTTLRAGTQQELGGLDFAVSQLGAKADFWESAEERIYQALRGYSEQAETTGSVQRRLFANDAAQGFAFIDLCRTRYDVVVMNPPFGEPSKGSKSYLETSFPDTHNDLLAAFVERFVGLLNPESLIGAITSRTAFFLSSFEAWRENVLLKAAPPTVVADLGQGVLDAAMVETAAYCLRRSARQQAIFIRLVKSQEKSSELTVAISSLCEGMTAGLPIFTVHPSSFEMIPGAPFSYWVSEAIRSLFQQFPGFEDNESCVRVTNPTADEFRFLRNFWEVLSSEIGRTLGWVPYAKGGSSRQFYYDVNLLAMWDDKTPTYKGYVGTSHRPDIRPASLEYFFRAGVMWPLRAPRLCAQAFPEGTVFSARSQCLFAPRDALGYYLGLLNSSVLDYLFKAALGRTDFPEFIIGILRKLPKPNSSMALRTALAEASARAASVAQKTGTFDEVGHLFVEPELASLRGLKSLSEGSALINQLRSKTVEALGSAQLEIDELSFEVYQLAANERRVIAASRVQARDTPDGNDESDDASQVGDDSSGQTRTLVSWIFGTSFGRWDIRYATGERSAPELPDPFAALPVCPPGMLQGDDGLPISPDAGRKLRAEGHYPLDVAWGGILVDDPEHPLDLVSRVQAALAVIWKDRAEAIEHEACELLGVACLRDWFRRPAGFFADHLKRYSKSRRQAPIYWPLSTKSGSYTLWIYYHRLNDQTLHTAIADFVEPKIKAVEAIVASARAANRTGELADAQEFLDELRDLKAELERLTKLPWRPNLNDGVLITASPLWKLFRLKKWQDELKACWEKLQRGDYDWAHLAYTLRPKEVEEKCKTDRSLAIAHGLEHLCQIEPPKPKAKRGKKAKIVVEEDEIL